MVNYQKGHVLSVRSESILACTLMWHCDCSWRLNWILPSLPLLAEYPQCSGASSRLIRFPFMSKNKYVSTWKYKLLVYFECLKLSSWGGQGFKATSILLGLTYALHWLWIRHVCSAWHPHYSRVSELLNRRTWKHCLPRLGSSNFCLLYWCSPPPLPYI